MKKDLKQFEYIATKDDVANAVRESEERLGKKLDSILTSVDGLAKKVSDFQTELYSNQGFKDRMQRNLEAFEKRLIRVELKTGIRHK